MTDLVHGQEYDVTLRLMYSSNSDGFYGPNGMGYVDASDVVSYTKVAGSFSDPREFSD